MSKALHVTVSAAGLKFGADTADEANTAQLDDTAMKYLSWVLYPLCIGGPGYPKLNKSTVQEKNYLDSRNIKKSLWCLTLRFAVVGARSTVSSDIF